MNAKLLNKTVDVALYALGGLLALYLFTNIISDGVFWSLASFLGFSSVAAIRELFVAKSIKSRIFAVIGIALTAVYGYGFVVQAEWADPDKFKFLLYVIFGAQSLSVLHGAVKSNFKVLNG